MTATGCPGRAVASRWLGVLVLLAAMFSPPSPAAGFETWLHINTGTATVSVMRGAQVLARFRDISIGRGGVSDKRERGDESTPLGEFRIVKIKEKSDFHRFYIIDYPNEKRASLALHSGEIDEPTYRAIRTAVRAGRLPPQGTPLGGNIGIHGLGNADLRFHEMFNWTRGCIALTDEQIDRLARWIHVGTRVVID